FLQHRTTINQTGIARLDAQIVVAARRGGHATLARINTTTILLDIAATKRINVVTQHFKMIDTVVVYVFERNIGPTAGKLIVRTNRLERVCCILGGRQATWHASFALKVMQRGKQLIIGGNFVAAFQDKAIDIAAIIAVTKALPMNPRKQDGATQAFIAGAANKQAGRGFDVAVASVHIGANAQTGRE